MPIPQFTDEELDEKLKWLFLQHQGKPKAIQRWALVVAIFGPGADVPQTDDNMNDRQIRSSVERLRSHGQLILDMGNGRGRYLAANEEEYREFRTSYLKPLRARANVIKAMDKAALEIYPSLLQPALFDMAEFRSVME